MASFSLVTPARHSPPMRGALSVAALLAAVILAAPLTVARAETPAKTTEHHGRAARHAETVEQRIANLHAALKITPEEEPGWQAVAQTIRDNAAALQKLASEKAAQMRQGATAVEDLQAYLTFAQAHPSDATHRRAVDGLQRLIAAFQTLYASMPDDQKKLADEVFRTFRQRHADRFG
jgi:periplasmic protein CpxP/Spy